MTSIRIFDLCLSGAQCQMKSAWSPEMHRTFDERVAVLIEVQKCPHFKAEQIAYWEIQHSVGLNDYYRLYTNPSELKCAYDVLIRELTETENKLTRSAELLFQLQLRAERYARYVENSRHFANDADYFKIWASLQKVLPTYMGAHRRVRQIIAPTKND